MNEYFYFGKNCSFFMDTWTGLFEEGDTKHLMSDPQGNS